MLGVGGKDVGILWHKGFYRCFVLPGWTAVSLMDFRLLLSLLQCSLRTLFTCKPVSHRIMWLYRFHDFQDVTRTLIVQKNRWTSTDRSQHALLDPSHFSHLSPEFSCQGLSLDHLDHVHHHVQGFFFLSCVRCLFTCRALFVLLNYGKFPGS